MIFYCHLILYTIILKLILSGFPSQLEVDSHSRFQVPLVTRALGQGVWSSVEITVPLTAAVEVGTAVVEIWRSTESVLSGSIGQKLLRFDRDSACIGLTSACIAAAPGCTLKQGAAWARLRLPCEGGELHWCWAKALEFHHEFLSGNRPPFSSMPLIRDLSLPCFMTPKGISILSMFFLVKKPLYNTDA